MDIAEARDRASAALETVRASPIVQRIESYRYDPPPLSWKAVLIILALFVIVFFLGRYGVADARDQWWRDQIAAKSSSVRAVIGQGRAEIDALDNEIIAALGDTDEKLSAAERALAKSRLAVTPDGCPRVPSICMRN